MRVLLITSPRIVPAIADFPPLGLGSVGSVAREHGHDVKIIDASNWNWKEVETEAATYSPDVIGITCWTIERAQAFETVRVVRRAAPQARIVVGGQHATAFPHHIFLKTPADFVVLGEGEETFGELLDHLWNASDVTGITGIAYRKGDQTVVNPRRPFIEDLDALPIPLHEQFDYRYYRGMPDTPRRAAAIITSRGCPFNCVFCSSTVYWGRKYRSRSVGHVLKEVDLLYHRYGVRALLFFDDNLTIDRERCIALSDGLYERKLDLVWAAEGTVKVDHELLKSMRRGGCYRIDFGVESGSPKVLRNINKAFSVKDTRNAFKLCRDVGIRPNAYLVLGAPGETRGTVRETVRLMKDIQPESVDTPRAGLWVLPNTTLHDMSVKQGIVSEERWRHDDGTFIYTGEHSQRELDSLVALYRRAMLRHQVMEPWRDVVELWRKRLRRLVTEPSSLLASFLRRVTS